MLFNQPVWLLLLIPLSCLLYVWRLPTRFLQGVRILLVTLLVLAMTMPMLLLPSRSGTVIVVADRSLSMPANAGVEQVGAINLLLQSIGREDRLGIVSFSAEPFVEHEPGKRPIGAFAKFASESARDRSNMAAAVEQAISLIPSGDKGRLLILSDGLWTGENPTHLTSRLIQRGIAVDYRLHQRGTAGDVAIIALDGPDRVLPNEQFKLTAWVRTPIAQEIEYELLFGDRPIYQGRRAVGSGDQRLDFPLKAPRSGNLAYRLRITGQTEDPVPENNLARKLVGIEQIKPLLLIAPKDEQGQPVESKMARIFQEAGVETTVSYGDNLDWSIPMLSTYSGIVLENVPSRLLGNQGMELISEWVKQTGTGLMMTGGRQAYAMGGYFKTPLETIMPVSMELRKEHRKMAIAVQAVLDCSGSMGAMVGGNRVKMDLANLGAAELFGILTPLDEVGVMVVDTAPNIVVPLKPNTTPGADRARTLKTGPGGGGILINVALREALSQLSRASAMTKHIILFTDASDSEQPGDYRTLMGRARDAGITLSVIALGTERDMDANMLKDLARISGGQCYFTEDAMDLPRLFAQDTFVIARSTFIEDPTPIRITGGLSTLTGRTFADPLPVGGYNLCYIQPDSMLAIRSEDENHAPILASRNAALGRVLCYMGQVDGKFTGPIRDWDGYLSLLASLGRWTAGQGEPLPNNMLATQEVQDGALIVRLFLDPEREESSLESLPRVMLLRQSPGTGVTSDQLTMRFAETEMLQAVVPLSGSETLQATLALESGGQTHTYSLPPVCLPYSPEFRPATPGKGKAALFEMAEATGGRERIELTSIWQDIPKTPRYFDLTPWLLYAACVLFLFEIFERRTGIMTVLLRRLTSRVTQWMPQPAMAGRSVSETENDAIGGRDLSWWQQRKRAREAQQALQSSGTPVPSTDKKVSERLPEESSSATQDDPDSMLGALQKARLRAKKRRGEE